MIRFEQPKESWVILGDNQKYMAKENYFALTEEERKAVNKEYSMSGSTGGGIIFQKRITNYKDFWAYKEIKKSGCKIKVLKKSVTFYDEYGVNAKFELVNPKFEGINFYLVYNDGECINDKLEASGEDYNEIIMSICYYYHTRH